jgi:hypothetical protein
MSITVSVVVFFTLYLFGLESRILNRAMQLGQVQQLGPIRGRARVDIKLTRGRAGQLLACATITCVVGISK